MKENILYIILAVAQVGVLVWYFTSARKKDKSIKDKKSELGRKYPYESMRDLLFSSVPGFIIASAPKDEFFIYSLIMDWHLGDDIVTLSVQATGESSLYVQSGGGIIGAGKHISVSEAAQVLLFKASQVLDSFDRYTETALPSKHNIAFYLLTNNGNFKIMETVTFVQNRHSKLFPLFEQANILIEEMKRVSLVK